MQLKSFYIFLLLLAGTYAKAQHESSIEKSYGQNRFINKSPFEVKDSVVRFFLRGNTLGKRVILSGNFINWSPDALLMNKTDSGWITDIKLGPGKYLYKFVIDGIWITDPDNSITETDDQGNVNSIFFIPNTVFTFNGSGNTQKVYLVASSLNWGHVKLQMYKAQAGWKLPLYLEAGVYNYHFIADGKKILDQKNFDELPDEKKNPSSVLYINVPDHVKKTFRSYQKAIASHNKREIADNLSKIGDIYLSWSDNPNAKKNYESSLTIYKQLRNYDSIGSVYMKIGEIARSQADFLKQFTSIQNAIIAFEQSKNKKKLADALWFKGIYYNNISGGGPSAVESFQKALILYQHIGDELKQVRVLPNLARYAKDETEATEYTKRALSLAEKIGDEDGKAFILMSMGANYRNKKNIEFQGAVKNFTIAQEIFENTKNKGGLAEILLEFARIYMQEPDSNLRKLNIEPSEKYAKAINNQKRSLQLYIELKNKGRQQFGINFLRETFENIGMYDSALFYYRRWVDGQNTYFNTERQKELARIETQFIYGKIEDSLTNEKKLTDEKLQTHLIFARHQQQQLYLSKTQLDLANKEKDLQHLANLKTQADLKNEQLIKQQKEKENQLQSTQLKSLTQKNAIIKLNQQRQWIYIIGGFLLLAVGSLYFIYRSRLHSVRLETQLVKEKAAQDKKESEFQHKLADISMSALRSQMNPHFIFNCLNSIKLYTTQNDTVAATEYLTKFSKLIRLVLENSRNERITLSSELAALQLYIEMEAMRFKEKLSYSFKVEPDVETGYIEIPPLLLQPYVENAIWHGLMPRDEGGHIAVNVSMQEHESILEIIIADNGIGREAATALNNKKSGKHHSYGMKATTERIQLINQIYKTGANVIVYDLVDDLGQASGTQVTIQIPV